MKNFSFVLLVLILHLPFHPAAARQAEETRAAAWQVLKYDISANVGNVSVAERSLSARATITARNVGEGTGRTFTVRINPDAKINSASVGDASARFTTRAEARTRLQQVTVSLPAVVPTGGTLSVSLDYQLPVAENSGIAAVSHEGVQFLPLAFWYPTPNSPVAPRGWDYAPYRLTVAGLGAGETVVSAGQQAAAGGATFEQRLNGQPFFLAGRWDVVEGLGEARGVSAWLEAGAGQEERRRGEELIKLAASARAFYSGTLGQGPDVPLRLVGVRRGSGFDVAGTLLLDHAAFRRTKTDSLTALSIAEAVARLWVGGSTAVVGEGAGSVREGMTRFLATLFLEKQFGKDVADAERMRIALLYAPVANRDVPLSQATPAFDTYFNTVANKGALAWRLAMNAAGRDAFTEVLRTEFGGTRAEGTTLARIRAALVERGGDRMRALLAGLFDQPTDTDLIVGLPQQRAGGWVAALRNMGSFDADVTVQATTESGQRLTTQARVPAKDFGEAVFQTTARITRVEVDPEKFYPQVDYSNDIAPKTTAVEDAIAQARVALTQQQFARAETLAREAASRSALAGEGRVLLGRALLGLGRLDEAEKEFRAVLDAPLPTSSALAWAGVGLGEIALRRGDNAEAARRFNEAARADAEYASNLAARAGRIRAEAAANAAPPVDESVKAAVAQLDQAIRSGKKAELDQVILHGELVRFSSGLIGTQPQAWQSRVVRTEALGSTRAAADVSITARTLGQDSQGTAVFVFTRTPAGWKLSDVQLFEVR